jgi:hypothetical protein
MTTAQFETLIISLGDNVRNPASRVRTILTAIKNEVFQIGEVKMKEMTPLEITTNFDSTGLGIGDSVGFAICNGLNGTRNRRRKVPVGYDSTTFVSGFDYSGVGNTFGSADAIVVNHSHTAGSYNTGSGVVIFPNVGFPSGGDNVYQNTDETGESATNKNIQPSIVTLFIQRIS